MNGIKIKNEDKAKAGFKLLIEVNDVGSSVKASGLVNIHTIKIVIAEMEIIKHNFISDAEKIRKGELIIK